MRRREFLQAALILGATGPAGALPGIGRFARAMGFPAIGDRVLVNLMLPGGPDMRHIFPPAFNLAPGSFGRGFWEAKAAAHAIDDTITALQVRWDNDYFHVSDGGVEFGIHRNCGWLKTMWDAGHVAIINNALGGRSRDHAHCIDIMDQGNLDFQPNQSYGSGWGGRLAVAATGNVLALTNSPRTFCYGPDPTNPAGFDNRALIGARDMRSLSLYEPTEAESALAPEALMTRSLKAYYAAKAQAMPPESVFHRFVQLEQQLREFGEPIDERLSTIPVPAALDALLDGGLANPEFARQIRNLHDAFACHDILNMRVASIDYGGWDSHEDQVGLIEPNLTDIFGTGKAFDTLYQVLPSDALDNMVLVVAGEFGRQLRANGDAGTDHGEGNSILVIGNAVAGGIYGEMFPEAELGRLNDLSPQIEGLTALDHIFGAVCDWVSLGSSATVFPNRVLAPAESGLDLSVLFT